MGKFVWTSVRVEVLKFVGLSYRTDYIETCLSDIIIRHRL